MFNHKPGFDKIGIVFAGRMAGLSWRVAGEGSFHICQVHNLAERGDGDNAFWLVRKRRSHIHCVDVTSQGERAAVENLVEGFDRTQYMVVGHFMDFAILPL